MTNNQRGGILFRLLAFLVLCALAGMVYLVRHPLLQLAARQWVVDDQPSRADVIIVLGDDDFSASRAAKAAALFRQGIARQIVASGRMLRPYASIADFMVRDLESQGVPTSAIVRFPHRADNTRDEAEALRPLIAQAGWHHLLLVTSNYHTRRARYIFRRVLPRTVDLEVVAAPSPAFDPSNWWESRQATKLFLLETLGFLDAMWELRGRQESASPEKHVQNQAARDLLTARALQKAELPAISRLHR